MSLKMASTRVKPPNPLKLHSRSSNVRWFDNRGPAAANSSQL
jgi:hypothetical protein